MRIGVIGAGNIARLHVQGLERSGHELVVVSDTDAGRAEALARPRGARATCDVDEFLAERLDLVTVTVPNILHHQVATRVVNAGHAVLCEKPMTRSAADSLALLELVRRVGKPFFTGYMKRSHPTVQKFVDYAKRIGTPRSGLMRAFHPFPLKEWDRIASELARDPAALRTTVYNDGAFVNSGSHMLDLLLLTAGPVRRVLASRFQRRPGCVTDTMAHALLEMTSGATITVECGWSPLTGVGRREDGWDEVLELRGDAGQARLFTTWWDRPDHEAPVADLWLQSTTTRESFNGGSVDYFAKQYELIELALRGEPTPLATAEDGYRVDQLIDDVFAAACDE